MSFGLPPLKCKPEFAQTVGIQEGAFGVPDLMTNGFSSVKSNLEAPHPVMVSEQNYFKRRDHLNMAMLRNTQGLHAPLRLAMECKAAKQVGHLPFLPSSNIMLDVITGNDIELGPQDIFNTSEFQEVAGYPHAVIERSLGLL